MSSTAIRQALIAGQVGLARRLLNHPFALEGTVVRGAGLGSKLRIPTANLMTPNELIPRKGVYVTIFKMDGRRYESVTNIGFRPTVSGDDTSVLSIEPHLLDFKQDLYGKEVTLEFMMRLRDELRFPDQKTLVSQIHRDIENARRYFRWLERSKILL